MDAIGWQPTLMSNRDDSTESWAFPASDRRSSQASSSSESRLSGNSRTIDGWTVGVASSPGALSSSSSFSPGRMPVTRMATRLELYQRLGWAKEFMDACYHEPLSLAQIAEVACLSPHHFLRLFKQLVQI